MRNMDFTLALSSSPWTGLEIKSSAPASKDSDRSSLVLSAVTIIMGRSCQSGSLLILRQISMPLISGIITSSNNKSGCNSANLLIISMPLSIYAN